MAVRLPYSGLNSGVCVCVFTQRPGEVQSLASPRLSEGCSASTPCHRAAPEPRPCPLLHSITPFRGSLAVKTRRLTFNEKILANSPKAASAGRLQLTKVRREGWGGAKEDKPVATFVCCWRTVGDSAAPAGWRWTVQTSQETTSFFYNFFLNNPS